MLQTEAKKAAPKTGKKVSASRKNNADTDEEECSVQSDDSDSAEFDSEAGDKSPKAKSKSTRTARASSKKAAKAIAAACSNLEKHDSPESPRGAGSDADTEPNDSPSAVARAAAFERFRAAMAANKIAPTASAAADAGDASGAESDSQGAAKQGSPNGPALAGASSNSPARGQGRRNSPVLAEGRKASRARKSLALDIESDTEPAQNPDSAESDSDAEPVGRPDSAESDAEPVSPVAAALKSCKVSKGNANAKRGVFQTLTCPMLACALQLHNYLVRNCRQALARLENMQACRT